MSAATERRFVMTKVYRGDYLLPSNDGKTLWRITEYAEDGSASFSIDGKTWKPLVGTFWQVAKFKVELPGSGEMADDFLDWGYWETVETNLLKRKYAVEVVLNRG